MIDAPMIEISSEDERSMADRDYGHYENICPYYHEL